MTNMLTVYYIQRLKLPLCCIVLGAYAAASHAVGQIFSPLVDYIGLSLDFVLFALCAITFLSSVVHRAKGDLFRAR